MEPESSLPYSQLPATCPYPEPHQFSPCLTFHFLEIHFNIILPSMPGSSKWSLSLRLPHQTLYMPVLSPYVLHAPPTSFWIWSPEQYWVRSTDHYAHLVVFSIPCYLIPLSPKYSQQPILEHPQPTFLPLWATKFHTYIKQQQNYSPV